MQEKKEKLKMKWTKKYIKIFWCNKEKNNA